MFQPIQDLGGKDNQNWWGDALCYYDAYAKRNGSLTGFLGGNALTSYQSCPKPSPSPSPSTIAGDINCRQNLPTDGVNMQCWQRVADTWRKNGKNYMAECAGDVIDQARAAGLNPDAALWVWLHESGASNYQSYEALGKQIEDFGIHTGLYASKNDFTKQLQGYIANAPGKVDKCGKSDMLTFYASYWFDECDPSSSTMYNFGGNKCSGDDKGNETDTCKKVSTWILTGDAAQPSLKTALNNTFCGSSSNIK